MIQAKSQTLDLTLRPKLNPESILQRYSNDSELVSLSDTPIVKNLADLQDVQIFAKIYIGENKQPFDMIFDTGSNWLWVDSDQCENCPRVPLFHEDQSDSYEMIDDYLGTSLYYGTGEVHGKKSQDQVCITEDYCSDDFTFMVVMRQKGLERLACSGIVGMSPNHFEEESDLFIEKMKETGAIDEALFSLSIGMNDQQSKITFGGYDTDSFATGPMTWHSIDRWSTYWEVTMN